MRKATADPPARRKILEAARHLFLEKGYEGASVDAICRSAKLTKGSFFHYFKTKDEVCEAALEQYCGDMRDRFTACCCPETKDPLTRIYAFLDGLARFGGQGSGKGCLMGALGQELSDTRPAIRKMCDEGFGRIAAFMEQELAEAKKAHKPKKPVDPKALAQHFVAVMQGAMLLARVRRDGSVAASEIGHYKEYLKQLFGR
jgi:TetR/AcrR family transcriptional repressor of nem operon